MIRFGHQLRSAVRAMGAVGMSSALGTAAGMPYTDAEGEKLERMA